MGYELNKLMKQYGVATPTMAGAPQMPGSPPMESAYTGAEGSPGTAEKYAEDKKAFDERVRKYGLAQKEYNQYQDQFQNRLANTNMYNQAQFSTTGANVPGAMSYVPQEDGSTKFERVSRETGTQYGTPQWTDTVRAPSYGVAPITLAGKPMQENADWYLGQRGIGYTDADLRGGSEKTFGPIDDASWRSLLNTAYPQYSGTIESAYSPLGRSGYGTNVGQIDDSGYNYWLNQLSSGAVNPEGLNAAVYKAGVDWNPAQGEAYDLSNVPQNFDWTYYVNNNPDLLKAKIDTRPEAQMHYAAYGMNEGRSPYEGWTAPVVQPVVNTNTNAGDYGSNQPFEEQILGDYAQGGAVKGYQDGGLEDRGTVDPDTGAIVYPVPDVPPSTVTPITSRPIYDDPVLESAAQAIDRTDPVVAAGTPDLPVTAGATRSVGAPPLDARAAALQSMLERYGPRDADYGSQITDARNRAATEQTAFADMLRAQLDSPEDAASSKAEMYFRLAAAFGSPSKTGHFTENLSLAGKEMAETAKSQRESRAKKLGIRMELQKMKMDAANKELDTLRALEQESSRDRRVIAQEMIREYIASGKPQSTAGKTATDMGLTPGTPEFTAKVEELTALEINRQTALINAQLASTAATTQRAGQMSPTEINLRTETENALTNIDQAIRDVSEAYRLNPNSYAGGWLDRGQRWLYEVAGSEDPRIVNTRRIDNLLGSQALGSLRAIFGGNPTEGERAILLELQGIGSRSLEERRQIMLRLAEVLEDRKATAQVRLDRILSGGYRTYTPLEGGQ